MTELNASSHPEPEGVFFDELRSRVDVTWQSGYRVQVPDWRVTWRESTRPTLESLVETAEHKTYGLPSRRSG